MAKTQLNNYRIKFNGTPIAAEQATNKFAAFEQWWKKMFHNLPIYTKLEFKDGVCQTVDRVELHPIGVGIVAIVPA